VPEFNRTAGEMITLQDFERSAFVHMEAAYNLAYWLLRDRDDAQDAVQDAYLRAFRAHGSVVGADIKPWLLTIVRNVAYRLLSARKRTANVIAFDSALSGRDNTDDGAFEVPSDEPSPEDVLVSRADQALVRKAIAELPTLFREVIILREFEDMSYHDIAAVTGVPIGTVMSRLGRARDQLRTRLTHLIAMENKNAL
jgi:RNA polymerase sigma factor (sigma-70 family)